MNAISAYKQLTNPKFLTHVKSTYHKIQLQYATLKPSPSATKYFKTFLRSNYSIITSC